MVQHLNVYCTVFFFHNAIILGLRGGEHSSIMTDDFKKCKDGGFDVYIYRSKTNQRELNNRRKAELGPLQ